MCSNLPEAQLAKFEDKATIIITKGLSIEKHISILIRKTIEIFISTLDMSISISIEKQSPQRISAASRAAQESRLCAPRLAQPVCCAHSDTPTPEGHQPVWARRRRLHREQLYEAPSPKTQEWTVNVSCACVVVGETVFTAQLGP